tara:strand:+ start:1029 stop:2954 length:1926 start_codon:yes stop_codon:yes gene_type:complete
VLSIFGVLLVSAFASAGTICGTDSLCMSLVDSPSTANHNSDNTVTFNVTYEGASSSVTLDFATSDGNTASWKTLPTGTSINKDETKQLTAVLNVPLNLNGVVNPVLNSVATGGAGASLNVPSITINDAASIAISKLRELSETQSGKINVTNTGNVDLTSVQLSDSGSFDVEFEEESGSSLSSFTLEAGDSKVVVVKNTTSLQDLDVGTNTVTITADPNDGNSESTSFSLLGSFCTAGNVGNNLTIIIDDIDNDGEGDTESWTLLDDIKVDVDVENIGDDDVDDVIIELGLFDSSGNNQVSDLEFESADEEEEQIGDLNDGKDETVTFRFKVPADFDDGDYKLIAKAYSDKTSQSSLCTQTEFRNIDVERENQEERFVIVDNIDFSADRVTCGDSVTISYDVFNIGDEDQEQTRVNVKSNDLGIDTFTEIKQDLDQGDSEGLDFRFTVPQNLDDKTYAIEFTTEYDYNSRRDFYNEESEDTFVGFLEVIGCNIDAGNAGSSGNAFNVLATLSSDAKAGEQMVVSATVTNTLDQTRFISVDASGFGSWAELDSISERILNLRAGESAQVTFTFNIMNDASGQETFDIDLTSADLSESREVVVNVEEGSSLGFGGNSSLIWILGIINVVLILLIIVVAVIVSRR